MSGYRAEPAALETVAGTLRSASEDLDGATPPPAPELGVCTAPVADLLARLLDQTGTVVQGMSAAADAVEASKTQYQEREYWSMDELPKPGPKPS